MANMDVGNQMNNGINMWPAATPSGQLSDELLAKMSLVSQRQQQPSQAAERAPVPLFSQVAPQMSQVPPGAQPEGIGGDVSCSQLEYLATPDFITPADQQFDVECEPGNNDAKHMRSPAQLSPNRIKRARKLADDDMQESSLGSIPAHPGRALPVGNPYAPPGGRRIARVHSPPCYRTIFADGEADQDVAAWRAPRPPAAQLAQLSRFRADFKEVGMLGQGNYSKVFRVRHRLDGREYAVKRTTREAAPDSPEFSLFLQEVQVMAHTPPHPNLVQYYASWSEAGGEGGERLYVQLELCDVALSVHANLGDRLQERDLVAVLRQVAAGLRHLHAHGIAHMDVKPDNIYLVTPPDDGGDSGGGGLAPGTAFKLGDFGQATRLGGSAAVNEGDSRYLPLEVLNSNHSALDKADMFALGATLYELASGAELPEGGKLYQDLRAGRVPLLPAITTPLHSLIKALMSPRPEDRPSAEKVLQSSLLNKHAAAEHHGTTQAVVPSGQMKVEGRTYGGLVLQRSKVG